MGRRSTGAYRCYRAEESKRLDRMRAEVIAIEAGRAAPARFRDPTKAAWVGEFLGTRFAQWALAPLTAWSIGQRDLLPSDLKVSTLNRHRRRDVEGGLPLVPNIRLDEQSFREANVTSR